MICTDFENADSGTISAGKSIFWKLTKDRLTSDKPLKNEKNN